MIANGTFARLANAGYMIQSNPDGSVVFRPRADMVQTPTVLNDYVTFDKSPQGPLAKQVQTRDPQIVVTWVGLQCMTPAGRGVILSVDVSTGLPTSGLVTVQHIDPSGTAGIVRQWPSQTISVAFQ